MITASVDAMLRTHDEARDCIRSAVPGARVAFYPKTRRSVGYEITVRRFGAPAYCVVGAYSLPALADRLADNARTQVECEMKR